MSEAGFAEAGFAEAGFAEAGVTEVTAAALPADAVVLIALDFDGTLAPLGDDPMAVQMVPGSRELLDGVASRPNRWLALVSGRPAGDLVLLSKAPVGTLIAASHGAQRGHVSAMGLVMDPIELSAGEADLLAQVEQELAEIAERTPGSRIESKPLARVLHTRRSEGTVAELAAAAAVAGPGSLPGVHTLVGKSVVEIAVRAVTKADGVAWARAQVAQSAAVAESEVIVVFAGDDTTDEHALASLGAGDHGIKVGAGPTAAGTIVADEHEAVAHLSALVL